MMIYLLKTLGERERDLLKTVIFHSNPLNNQRVNGMMELPVRWNCTRIARACNRNCCKYVCGSNISNIS